MPTFRTVAISLLGGLFAVAQSTAANPFRIWSEVAASSFGAWSVWCPIAIPSAGTYVVQLDFSNPPAVSRGPALQPFAINAPLILDIGEAQEIARPSLVQCSAGKCSLTLRFVKPHARGFLIASGSGGLQEAINYAHMAGGTVVLDPQWQGQQERLAAAAGYDNVAIHDERAGTDVWYVWNGASYQMAFSLGTPEILGPVSIHATEGQDADLLDWYSASGALAGGVGASGSLGTAANPLADLIAKKPWLDVRAFGASGSALATTGTAAAGSPGLSLAAALDFAVGQGIQIIGAGAPVVLGTPPAPSVVVHGAGGVTSCAYQITARDRSQGGTAASPAGTTAVAGATLGGANYITATWSAPAGAQPNLAGYAVYGECGGGAMNLLGIVAIPGYALPRIADFAYTTGIYVTPPTPNGHFYRVTTAGASGTPSSAAATTANWCATPDCAMTDGTAVYTEQPFTFSDFGFGALNPSTVSPAMPLSPPASPQADSLVTSVMAGAGTTALTLAAAVVTGIGGAAVLHDDTAALQAAIAAQIAATQTIPGFVISGTAPVVWLPNGVYSISSPIRAGGYLNLSGGAAAIIQNTNPFSPSLAAIGTYQARIRGLNLHGGSQAIYVNSPNLEGASYDVADVEIDNTTDYAAMFVGSGDGNLHLSAQVRLQGRFFNDRMIAWNGADSFQMDHAWIDAAEGNLFPNQAQFLNQSGSMSWNGVMAIPAPYVPGARWVDDYGSFTATESKFGAEAGGGFPCVYSFANHGTAGNGFQGGSISLSDDTLACGAGDGADSAIVDIMASFPTSISVKRAIFSLFEPFILDYGGVNLDTVFDDILAANQTPEGLVSVTCGPSSGDPSPCAPGQMPAQILPLLYPAEARQSAAVPTAGIWTAGSASYAAQIVYNRGYASSSNPVGWVVAQTGKAAPPTPRSSAVTAGQIFEDPTGANGHVYLVTTAGTTAVSPPGYATAPSSTTGDGTAILTEAGAAAQFSPFGAAASSWIAAFFATGSGSYSTTLVTPNQSLLATRLQVSFLSEGYPQGCSVAPSLTLTNGSTTTSAVGLANAQSADDSGVWNFTFAAGVPITLQYQPGTGCSTSPSFFTVNLQVQSP